MRLYLMQHGEALDKSINALRPLSERGRQDVQRMADFLKTKDFMVEEIWHSGKLRSLETAELLKNRACPEANLVECAELAPEQPARMTLKSIKKAEHPVAIVGHLPHLARLASLLVCDDEDCEPVLFQKGSVAALERGETPHWHICWMIIPSLLD